MTKPLLGRPRNFLVLIFTLVVAACGRPFYELEIELDEAVLATEKREIRMRSRSDRDFRILETPQLENHPMAPFYIHGSDTRNEIAIFLFPYGNPSSRVPNFFVGSVRPDGDVPAVAIQEASYYFNSGEAKPLLLEDLGPEGGRNPDLKVRVFHLTLPEELIAHRIERTGDGLKDIERYKDQLESENYRFKIVTLIDGERYILDTTFRFRIGADYPLGIGIH